MDPIEEEMAWRRQEMEGNTLIEPLALCCTLNPHKWGDNKWSHCNFCRLQICIDCMDSYLFDNYYHHKQCLTLCPHTRAEHDEE